MTKQTSIEWLIEQLAIIDKNDPYYAKILAQAKQMHKEEIEDAYGDGINAYRVDFCNREEYYQKTYGGNNE